MVWKCLRMRSQAALEYGLVLGFAVLVAVIVMWIVISIMAQGAKFVSNGTEKVLEELEEMRTSLIG